jgi:drug/metabolite transporter (DMT)-like permease
MDLHKTTGRWKFGLLLSLITAFLWGVTPIAIKVVLEEMDPYTISWYRFLFSAILISIWIYRRHGIPDLTIFRGSVIWLTILAIIGLATNYAFFMIGLNYLPPSTVTVVIQLAPMFLLFGSLLVFKEKFSVYQCIGFIILAVGLILFFNMRLNFLLSGFSSYALGIVFIVLAAITWAVYALAQKQLLVSFPSEIIMLFIYSGCFILFTPFSKPTLIFHLGFIKLLLLIFACFTTVLAYGSFSEALNHLEASRISTVLAILPLITIVSMKAILIIFPECIEAEPLNLLSVTGAFMVVFGSMTSSLIRSRNN